MPSFQARIAKLFLERKIKPENEKSRAYKDERSQQEFHAFWIKKLTPGAEDPFSANGVSSFRIRASDGLPEKVILHFHGGGYVSGSENTHKSFAVDISKACNAQVILPQYRLAPEHRFPAALEDATMVYTYLLEQKIQPGNIILSGDSAGGGLAVALAIVLRDGGLPMPAGIICISPWTDLTCSGASYDTKKEADPVLAAQTLRKSAKMYAGKADLNEPLISPVFADLKGLPPLLIQVGSEEILLDDSVQLAAKAKKAGVKVELRVWQGMWHVWPLLGGFVPESMAAIKELAEFTAKLWPE